MALLIGTRRDYSLTRIPSPGRANARVRRWTADRARLVHALLGGPVGTLDRPDAFRGDTLLVGLNRRISGMD